MLRIKHNSLVVDMTVALLSCTSNNNVDSALAVAKVTAEKVDTIFDMNDSVLGRGEPCV